MMNNRNLYPMPTDVREGIAYRGGWNMFTTVRKKLQ